MYQNRTINSCLNISKFRLKLTLELQNLAAEKLETTKNLIQSTDVNLLEETTGVADSRYAMMLKEAAKKSENANVACEADKVAKKKRKRKPKLQKKN